MLKAHVGSVDFKLNMTIGLNGLALSELLTFLGVSHT